MPRTSGSAPPSLRYDAIVLAGGRGSRLGGVDKGALVVAGRTLLELALLACADADRVVVVGPGPLPANAPAHVLLTREEPPYAGPAAAVVAGLRRLGSADADTGPGSAAPTHTLLLACDLPPAVEAVAHLLAHAGPHADTDSDGWCLSDPGGRRHWLIGLYRTEALARAADELGDPTDHALGRLLGRLALTPIRAPRELTADVDSPRDAARLGPLGPVGPVGPG